MKIFKYILMLSLSNFAVPCIAENADVTQIIDRFDCSTTIGITQIIDHPALNSTYEGIIDTLSQYKDIKILRENAQGNIGMSAQIAQKFVGAGVKAIIAISTPSTQSAVTAVKGTEIPVFFASVTDPKGVGLVKNLQRPEGQVTGCSNLTPLVPQLELFKEIIPKLKHLGILYNPGEVNSIILIEKIKKAAHELNINIITAPVNSSAEISAATRRLIDQVDAFFISNDNTVLSAFSSIVKIATASGKPIFVSDTDLVDQGAIAALGPNQYQIGVITAKMVHKYLIFSKKLSIKPSTEYIRQLAVGYPTDLQLYLNQTQAQKLNIIFPEYLLQKANKIL